MEKKVSYNDYLFMSVDEEDKKYFAHDFFKDMSVTFMEYFKYMLDDNFKDIESHILNGVGMKKWQNHSDDDIVESSLAKSPKDRIKKKKQKNYYKENAACAFETLKFIFTEDLYNQLEKAPSFIKRNYAHILKYFLIDVDQLINEYEANINENPKYYSNPHRAIHTMSLHNVLRQSAYGRASFHSFSDIEIDASIAIIRQMIEMRIRRGFGIISFIDDEGNVKPLDMSSIFDILKKYKKDIEFPAKLESLERIYRWGNLYIHTGCGDYAWITYFLEKYLRTLSFGEQKENGSWSYNNGIKTTREILKKIKEEIQELHTELKILECKPECEIILETRK